MKFSLKISWCIAFFIPAFCIALQDSICNYFIKIHTDLSSLEIGEYKNGKKKNFYKGHADSLSVQQFKSLFSFTKDSAELLIYLHCWLGNEKHFHQQTLNGLMSEAKGSRIKNFVSVIWVPETAGYLANSKAAPEKGRHLCKFMVALCELFPQKTNILCHSMGNAVFAGLMQELDAKNNHTLLFNEVILAAADVNEDVFEQAFKHLPRRCKVLHIFTHKKDRLLKVSHALQRKNRLGLAGPENADSILKKFSNIVLTDVSNTTSLRRPDPSNHVYFYWNKSVRIHLHKIFIHGVLPQQLKSRKLSLNA